MEVLYMPSQWLKIESSNLAALMYDETLSLLYVEFKGGTIYVYPRIQQTDFDAFTTAESKGKHFHAHIRSRANNKVFDPFHCKNVTQQEFEGLLQQSIKELQTI